MPASRRPALAKVREQRRAPARCASSSTPEGSGTVCPRLAPRRSLLNKHAAFRNARRSTLAAAANPAANFRALRRVERRPRSRFPNATARAASIAPLRVESRARALEARRRRRVKRRPRLAMRSARGRSYSTRPRRDATRARCAGMSGLTSERSTTCMKMFGGRRAARPREDAVFRGCGAHARARRRGGPARSSRCAPCCAVGAIVDACLTLWLVGGDRVDERARVQPSERARAARRRAPRACVEQRDLGLVVIALGGVVVAAVARMAERARAPSRRGQGSPRRAPPRRRGPREAQLARRRVGRRSSRPAARRGPTGIERLPVAGRQDDEGITPGHHCIYRALLLPRLDEAPVPRQWMRLHE